MTYYDFIKEYMSIDECENSKKYSGAGYTFCWDKDGSVSAEGLYWLYKGDGFIIDIHDFYTKEEVIQNNTYSMENYTSICSSYIASTSGGKFNPYQALTPSSLYTPNFDNIEDGFLFLLHESGHYLTVSVGFKKELLKKHLLSINIDLESFYRALLQINQITLTKSLKKVAVKILNYEMNAPVVGFFFKAKTNEWISIVTDACLSRRKYKIESNGNKTPEDVSRFLDDHFIMTVNRETLEKISKMSGTKLKSLFKEKYG